MQRYQEHTDRENTALAANSSKYEDGTVNTNTYVFMKVSG